MKKPKSAVRAFATCALALFFSLALFSQQKAKPDFYACDGRWKAFYESPNSKGAEKDLLAIKNFGDTLKIQILSLRKIYSLLLDKSRNVFVSVDSLDGLNLRLSLPTSDSLVGFYWFDNVSDTIRFRAKKIKKTVLPR